MPPTGVHDRITVISAVLLTAAALAIPADNRWLPRSTLIGSHFFSGVTMCNDLDTQAVEYRRW